MRHMTARADTQQSRSIMAKRADATPKAKTRRGVRGADKQATVHEARSRGINNSTVAACETISPDKPLTDKQKAFVKFWAQGESIQSASARAGYADGAQMAYRLVHMPNILALKSKYEAEWIEESQMTRKKVMDGMLESIEMAKLMAEPASMIAGWREIGKICGYYAPVETRVKIDVSGNVVLGQMNSMTDAELLKLISRDASAPLLESISGG